VLLTADSFHRYTPLQQLPLIGNLCIEICWVFTHVVSSPARPIYFRHDKFDVIPPWRYVREWRNSSSHS